MPELDKIFKAYDVRGVVPDELDESVAEAAGAAFVRLTGAKTIVTLHDMRSTSEPLATALGRGAASQGANVIQGGLGSTDMAYYASGFLDIPGAMITASHNPAKYNGMKLCKTGAKPVGIETGLAEIKLMVAAGVPAYDGEPGTVTSKDLLPGYAEYLKKLVDISGIRPLKVVVDAGNGMGGYTVPTVFEGLPITTVPLYFELDGSFPNHEANPIDPENLRDLQKAVRDNHADIGLSVPLVYPFLLYLLVRMLLLAFGKGIPRRPLSTNVSANWLMLGVVFLLALRIGLDVFNSNVIDVGYAGVIGAQRISDGRALYGHYPSNNEHGDT